ncbi:cytochrome P450 [Nocardia terpenica]|nr:cytochrome P450 [Nocardia terpenica]
MSPDPAPMPMARRCPFDPPEEYRGIRGADPIHRIRLPSGDYGWLVTRFADVRQVLSDARFSHRNDLIEPPVPPDPITEWVPTPPDRGTFNMMDAPDHTRYRRMLTRYFSSGRTERMADRIAEIANEQVDRLVAAGAEADLVADYAVPLAGRVICEMLGVPESEQEQLQRDVDTTFCLTVDVHVAYKAILRIGEAVERIVADRLAAAARLGSGDAPDVLTDLAARGDLDAEELRSITGVLLIGGMDTTANMLGLGALALLRNPEQLRLFRSGSDNSQVDELLRWLTISQWGASRRALEDVVVGAAADGTGGQPVRAGELVVLALNAANRDAAAFDDPDRLDLTRAPGGHVAFGHGAHLCIGHHLARVTLRVGWTVLFSRLPGLRVTVPDSDLRMRDQMTHYGVHELPVAFA